MSVYLLLLSNILSEQLYQTVSNQSGFLLVMALIIIVAVALILNARSKNAFAESFTSDEGHHEEEHSPDVETASEETVQPDDLKLIEGIGPKIASLLNENGIFTFNDLAGTSVEKLEELLDQPRLRMADPGTWPQQAELAASGKMEELAQLQEDLKGGKEAS